LGSVRPVNVKAVGEDNGWGWDPITGKAYMADPTKYYGATDWRAAQDAWVAAGMKGTPPPGKGDPYWDQFYVPRPF